MTRTRNDRTVWGLGAVAMTFVMLSCGQRQTYEEVVKEELAKEIRYDSIIYDIKLGMTLDDFYFHCFRKNLDGVFKPNASGTMAYINFTEGFSSPVRFEFFPEANQMYDPIHKYRATLKYQNFSYYNKKYAIENLVKEAIGFFEKGYGGNDFFTVPNKNKLLKYTYIKVDGNRKIVINPNFTGDLLELEFEDLSPKNITDLTDIR